MPAAPKPLLDEISTDHLSKVLGLTDKRIRQLAQEGILQHLTDANGYPIEGRWSLSKSVQAYVEYKVLKEQLTDVERDMEREKLLKLRAERVMAEANTDVAIGKAIRTSDAERVWGKYIQLVKNKLLSLPTKLSSSLTNIADPKVIGLRLIEEINEALEELAGFNIAEIQAENNKLVLDESIPQPSQGT